MSHRTHQLVRHDSSLRENLVERRHQTRFECFVSSSYLVDGVPVIHLKALN
jgi:hypothetical protein